VADIDERRSPGEPPEQYARRLAREKAAAVAGRERGVILAADTVVVVGDQILEKPTDPSDARRMLQLLAGREHEVITAICILHPSGEVVDAAHTRVRFSAISDSEIDDYVASGEPGDKAGAYGIQGRASKFIEHIEGCYFNVVGLPIALVYRHLRGLGAHGGSVGATEST
jgi:septum formation protein